MKQHAKAFAVGVLEGLALCALVLVVIVSTGCTTSILGGGLPKSPDSVNVEAKAEKRLVDKVAKLMREGTPKEDVVALLVAAGETEQNALRLIALSYLR